jgi:outer membrane receptor protein involved in Fe transport
MLSLALLGASAIAQTSTPTPTQDPSTQTQKPAPIQTTVEVTATRLPEDPAVVPTAIQVFSGDELRARGVNDLRSALSSAIGVNIAPGGDSGPASSVPEFWGLKEFDAFLLVVDGVPWGGAFNPALTAVNLNDVERIEVLRGPAAVTYGATSFVGVIHVVNRGIESPERTLTLHGGSYGSGGASFSTPIPLGGDWASRLTIEGERMGFSDDRTAYRRGHAQWRLGNKGKDSGRFWINGDLNWLDQDPASPRPREGTTLSPNVPVDSNHNPGGSFLNDHRGTGMFGFDRDLGNSHWYSTFSISHARQDILRGFLEEIDNVPDNARGLREKINLTDVYFDTHFAWKLPRSMNFISGVDYLHGTGNAKGADFDYTVPLLGAAVPVTSPSDLDVTIKDHRNFLGPYASLEWSPFERVRIDAGLRANITHESRTDADGGAGTSASSDRTDAHVGASIGAMVTAWQHQEDSIGFFANYRETFKPAAIDFGIGEGFAGKQILDPETSRSIEGGIKGRFWDRRAELELSGFLMDFENLVTAVDIGGLPGLINAGEERFKGFESGVSFFLPRNVIARGSYSYHDARFTDFVQDFGGVPTQLAGKRLEMSPNHLASFSIYYAPLRGITAGVSTNYSGDRYLNKRNTALADGFATVDLSAGYRAQRWEIRVDARNLGDVRDPVAESELGDAQYYLMPSRRVDATLRFHF